MTGKVNAKPFLGFQAGEWLFMGADVRCRYEEEEEDENDDGEENRRKSIGIFRTNFVVRPT